MSWWSNKAKQCLFVWILSGGDVTAAFEAQRQAEPHGPLARISLDMDNTVWYSKLPYNVSQLLLKFPSLLTGELWTLHRLAGPLGVTSLCPVICHSGQGPRQGAGHGSKRQHVSVQISVTCMCIYKKNNWNNSCKVISLPAPFLGKPIVSYPV